MNYPEWAPAEIVSELIRNEKNTPSRLGSKDMWERLVTKSEMKPFWEWIGTLETGLPLLANGGLVGWINREVAAFNHGRKLSNTDYRNEMLKITKLAKALSKEIGAFRKQAEVGLDPFPFSSALNRNDIDGAEQMIRQELLSGSAFEGEKRRKIQWILDSTLPSIDAQLLTLGQYAEDESKRQFYKLHLPRKVNDKNVFRTYFVKTVIDHFCFNYFDYSPSRIALFCSIALDDDQIDSDMVQKHCHIDSETRALLADAKSHYTSAED